MTELRPAEAADVPHVCEFLSQNMGRGMSAEAYQPIFSYPWMLQKPNHGFVLTDNGRIVGFLGAIYADRPVAGTIERFCNLTSWCVLPAYRSESLRLLFAVLKDPRQTVTNLSPTPDAEKLLSGLRYQRLDTYKLFAPVLAHAYTLLARPKPEVLTRPESIVSRLSQDQLKIFQDHQGIGCQHVVLALPGEYCYTVSKKRRKKGLSFSEILYVHNPGLLLQHFELAKQAILRCDRTWLLAIDERLLERRPPLVWRYRRVSMFKSKRVEARHCDNLYSEIALL